MKKNLLFLLVVIVVANAEAQNVGIGTATPAYKLDVAGRVRVQHGTNTAGIYFDGTTLPIRSFIGTLNDSTAGLWGGGGAGWNFVMNVNTGNLGIGNTTPQYPLNFSNAHGDKISFWNGVGNSYGIGLQSALLQIHTAAVNNDIVFGYGSSEDLTETMRIKGNGNVGIGTDAPLFKLDLAGRMRLQHNTSASQTAGLWLDGTTTTARTFFGTIDNDHAGIFGNGGAGWKFSFNVINGFVGIGTSAPTANLDINGSMRIRSSFPKAGSVLTSNDANGNAEWKEAIAFKAVGRNNDVLSTISLSTWTKVYFNVAPEYNLGLTYNGPNSEYVVPENGIYSFNVRQELLTNANLSMMRLQRKRGVQITTLAESTLGRDRVNDGASTAVRTWGEHTISVDAKLEAGDIIYVEIYYSNSVPFAPFPYSELPQNSYFSGHLIARI